MKMKYKIGDKVRIKEDLIVDEFYVKPYIGKTMTIDSITRYGYKLKEDTYRCTWTDEMLENVEEGIDIFVDGNKVIAKRDGRVGIARCSPEDEFDIFTGARLAIDRLEEKCKSYSWLKEDVTYYVPKVLDKELYDFYTYSDGTIERRLISRGLVFKTKEEAVEAAKKMLAVLKEG